MKKDQGFYTLGRPADLLPKTKHPYFSDSDKDVVLPGVLKRRSVSAYQDFFGR